VQDNCNADRIKFRKIIYRSAKVIIINSKFSPTIIKYTKKIYSLFSSFFPLTEKYKSAATRKFYIANSTLSLSTPFFFFSNAFWLETSRVQRHRCRDRFNACKYRSESRSRIRAISLKKIVVLSLSLFLSLSSFSSLSLSRLAVTVVDGKRGEQFTDYP